MANCCRRTWKESTRSTQPCTWCWKSIRMRYRLPRVSTRREKMATLEGLSPFPSVMWSKHLMRTNRPLHGLPILVKDLIGTNDKMETAGKCLTPCFSIVPRTDLLSRLVCTRWRKSTRRFDGRRQTQRKRCHHSRQDKSLRMGELQILRFI